MTQTKYGRLLEERSVFCALSGAHTFAAPRSARHGAERYGTDQHHHLKVIVRITRRTSEFLRPRANPALNLAPFGRWTLRNKAAQRRLALR
jgi:hypothetical protein